LQAEAILRKNFPHLLVTTSCAVLPEMKEYERTSTTVVNAYLLAAMRSYLQRLESGLRSIGIAAPILVMTSNGGMLAANVTCEKPVLVVASGPAGGVIGASHAAKLAHLAKCISFDMGGTSTDVALLTGELRTTSEAIVAGLPVAVPMLEIHTVGAGGGSIARFDEGGALRRGRREVAKVVEAAFSHRNHMGLPE